MLIVTAHRHLQHRNIIKFIGCEKGNGIFRLLMEQVPGGSLTSLVEKYGPLTRCHADLVDYSTQVSVNITRSFHGAAVIPRCKCILVSISLTSLL
jgi:hypothetical protein